ncbi:hypothetical protein I3843_02G019100 [Carya illinoinensis]|nr:hypothetical protein I3843_02G019100 [Carya illinoinensis]
MEACMGFLDRLDPDILLKIFTYVDDPYDLVRVSSISRSWQHFVIANGLWKQLCLRKFSQLSRVAHVVELNKCWAVDAVQVGSSYSKEWEYLERDDRAYALLARASTTFTDRDCILKAISASSTDNYPEESICNTLHPANNVRWRASYWSSKGQSNPAVPETLEYKLVDEFCVITEINLRPFQVYFDKGLPICSAKSVRFRVGHPKSPTDSGNDLPGYSLPDSADDKFVWTYTSQEFPMAQESHLQKFRLPEPVLCVGGILQIELLGRVHRCEIDGLYYICISFVQVLGRPLSPAFGVEILEPCGKFVLKIKNHRPFELQAQSNHTALAQLQKHLRDLQHISYIANMLHGNGNLVVNIDESEMDEGEDEYLL